MFVQAAIVMIGVVSGVFTSVGVAAPAETAPIAVLQQSLGGQYDAPHLRLGGQFKMYRAWAVQNVPARA